MNKTFGIISDYATVRKDISRIIISYDLQTVDEVHYTWNEIYFYKKQTPNLSLEQVKEAVVRDINAQTDEKIQFGFVWNGKPVWLSSENQFNFKAAYDLAIQTQGQSLPIKFKLGEDKEGKPIYHIFEEITEFTDFYTKALTFINQCLNEGWKLKDSIDWSEYENLLPI